MSDRSAFKGDGGELSQKALVSILGVFAVDDLPAAGNFGLRAWVTDANSTTFNATAASGGANHVPVFDNGTVWKIG